MHFTLLFSKANKPIHRAIKRGKRDHEAKDLGILKEKKTPPSLIRIPH